MTRRVPSLAVALLCIAALSSSAQDTRVVTEPTFPATCTVLNAQLAIVSGAPSSETLLDTSRIQAALNACTTGKAVELAPSADGLDYAFLMSSITIPTGVGLTIDGGVTVFASRNPADYQVAGAEACGGLGAGNGCNPIITIASPSTGSGIYGFGIIDGRGASTMLVNGVDSGLSWWQNADLADTTGKGQDNPEMLGSSHGTNLTLYKTTFRSSPHFHIGTNYSAGLTIWGIKVQAPWNTHNTDGIDPQGTNMTIASSSISDGDDDIAVGASQGSSNVTIQNVTTYSGHGISVGSYTGGNLSNMLVQNINMAGTAADKNGTGIHLKTAADRGGLVQNVTYQNICLRDTKYAIAFDPFYNTNPPTSIPTFQNITVRNFHALTPSPTANAYRVQFDGYDINHITTLTLDNVVFDQLLAANLTPAPQDVQITLTNNVYPSLLQTLTGPGVSYLGSATATATTAATYNCSALSTIFPYIVGELYLSTTTSTNLPSTTISSGSKVTLNAMVEPATSPASYSSGAGTYVGAALPTAAVNFYEGTTLVGTGTFMANGSLATKALSGVTVGTHTYTAQYPGDANYAALAFGSVTVTVVRDATTTTLTAPATSTYGTALNVTATVTAPSDVPTGQVSIYDGTTLLTTVTLTTGSATATLTLTGGTHTLSAVYAGDTSNLQSTSLAAGTAVTQAASSTAVTANPVTIAQNGNVTMTATVMGITGKAIPTGTVTFTDGTSTLGTATLASGASTLTITASTAGQRTYTATYSGDPNYAVSSGSAIETVFVPTTTTLSVPAAAYPGSTVTLTATVTPTVAGLVVSFLNGTSSLGSATTNASGIATISWTAATTGTYLFAANVAASGSYTASTSTSQSISVITPFTLSATPTTLSIAPGASGTSVLSIASLAGFAGTAAVTCTSPVAYVTCTIPSASTTITSGGTNTLAATIQIAATLSANQTRPTGILYTWIALPGLLAFLLPQRRRRFLPLAILLATACLGTIGCGSSSSAATVNRPTGTQTVTLTVTAAGVSQSLALTVNIGAI